MNQIIRVDTGKQYLTQHDNKIRPNITCASTAMAMALRYSGYGSRLDKLIPKGQDEDFITNYIHTNPDVVNYWQFNRVPWIRQSYQQYLKYTEGEMAEKHVTFGNEIHDIMSYAINHMLGHIVCTFREQTPLKSIVFNLLSRGSTVLSGAFPFKNTIIHHMVTLAGIETTQDTIQTIKDERDVDITKIVHFIIDDPYGDYRTRYRSTSGNDVFLPLDDAYLYLKEQGNTIVKRALMIKPAV